MWELNSSYIHLNSTHTLTATKTRAWIYVFLCLSVHGWVVIGVYVKSCLKVCIPTRLTTYCFLFSLPSPPLARELGWVEQRRHWQKKVKVVSEQVRLPEGPWAEMARTAGLLSLRSQAGFPWDPHSWTKPFVTNLITEIWSFWGESTQRQ